MEIVRHWEDESSRIVVRGDLAQSYEEVDRFADALEIWRDLYARQMQLRGASHERTLMCHTKVDAHRGPRRLRGGPENHARRL